MSLTLIRQGGASGRRLRSSGGETSPLPSGTIVDDDFNRNVTLTYDNTINGSADSFWLMEPGDAAVQINSGIMTIPKSSDGFGRLYSQVRYGGPGKAVRYHYRSQITQFHSDNGWGGYRGFKMGMKFPSSNSSYNKDDPRSVVLVPHGGQYGAGQSAGYILVNGMTDIGHYELALLGYDDAEYLGFPTTGAPPNTGMFPVNVWTNKSIEFAWVGGNTVRVRSWDNLDASGTPVWEYNNNPALALDAGYLWCRIDFVTVKMSHFSIKVYDL